MKSILSGTGFKLIALAFLALPACGPRDVAVEGSNSFGGSSAGGKAMTVSTAGDRASTCPAKNKDFGFLSGFDDFNADILAGKVTGFLSAGDRNCFRIGSEVNMQDSTKAASADIGAVKVKVVRVEILKVSDISSAQATPFGMTVTELKAFAQAEVDKAVAGGKFDPKGMVNLTFFEVVDSSVSAALKANLPVSTKPTTPTNPTTPTTPTTPTAPVVANGVTTISAEGERSATCPAKNADFAYVSYGTDNKDKVLAGDVSAYLSAGDRNCFRVGAVVNWVNPANATPDLVSLKVKITRIEILAVAAINQSQADEMGMTLAELQAYAQSEIDRAVAGGKFDPRGMINITFFEINDGTAATTPTAPTTPVTTPTTPVVTTPTAPAAAVTDVILLFAEDGDRATTCPAANKDYNFLSSTPETAPLISAGEITAVLSIGDRNCYRVGSVISFKDQETVPDADKFLITAVQIVPVAKLNKTQAAALKMDLATLETYVATEIANTKAAGKFDPKNTVTITFFQKVLF